MLIAMYLYTKTYVHSHNALVYLCENWVYEDDLSRICTTDHRRFIVSWELALRKHGKELFSSHRFWLNVEPKKRHYWANLSWQEL